MSKFVAVTYDLHEPYPDNSHRKVNNGLKKLGLKKKLKKSDLPANIFARKLDTGQSPSEVRDRIRKKVDKIFKRLGLNRTLFIFIGEGWAWENSPRE